MKNKINNNKTKKTTTQKQTQVNRKIRINEKKHHQTHDECERKSKANTQAQERR